MDTEKMNEQGASFEVDFMHLGADEIGKVRNGKAAKSEQVKDTDVDVVFIPAFDLDEKSMDPALLQAFKDRDRARKTEGSIRRNNDRIKSKGSQEIR